MPPITLDAPLNSNGAGRFQRQINADIAAYLNDLFSKHASNLARIVLVENQVGGEVEPDPPSTAIVIDEPATLGTLVKNYLADAPAGQHPIQVGATRIPLVLHYGQSNSLRGGAIGRALSDLRFAPYPHTQITIDTSVAFINANGRFGVTDNSFDIDGFAYPLGTEPGFTITESVFTKIVGHRDVDLVLSVQMADHTAFQDLVRMEGKTPVLCLAYSAGQGGEGIASFVPTDGLAAPAGFSWGNSKGPNNYANLLAGVTAAKRLAATYGRTIWVPFVDWTQGEGFQGAHPSGWAAGLAQLQARADVDIRAITGQSETVRFAIMQTALSDITTSLAATQEAPLAAANSLPLLYPTRFFALGTMYAAQLVNSNAHPGITGRKQMAGVRSEAYMHELMSRKENPQLKAWNPLRIVSLRPVPGEPLKIRATYSLPVGTKEILIDSDLLGAVPNLGFVSGINPITAAVKATGAASAVDVTFTNAPDTVAGGIDYAILSDNSGVADGWSNSRGLIYAPSLRDSPFWRRSQTNAEAGDATLKQKIRHYALSERRALSDLTVPLSTQIAPDLQAAIAAQENLEWWIGADSSDVVTVGSTISDFKNKKAGAASAVVFTPTASTRRGLIVEGAIAGTEQAMNSTQVNGQGIYGYQGTQPDLSGAWTMAALCFPKTGLTSAYAIAKYDAGGAATQGSGLLFGVSGTTLFARIRHGTGVNAPNAQYNGMSLNNWYLVFGSRGNDGKLRIRINGLNISEIDTEGSLGAASSSVMTLGGQFVSSNVFSGPMLTREAWFWNGSDLIGSVNNNRIKQIEEYVQSVYGKLIVI